MASYRFGVFTFDRIVKRAVVDSGITLVTVQQVYNACREYEAEPANLDNPSICKAEGKASLGGTKTVGITMTLLDGWQIEFTTLPAEIDGGNFLGLTSGGADQNPIFGNVVTRSLDSTAIQIETGVSGLTPTEAADLNIIEIRASELWTLLGLNAGDKITITPAGVDSASGDIDVDFTGDGISVTEMERQP